MDRQYWLAEARRIRTEGRHLCEAADEIETAAREATPVWHEPENSAASASSGAIIIIGIIAGLALIWLAIHR